MDALPITGCRMPSSRIWRRMIAPLIHQAVDHDDLGIRLLNLDELWREILVADLVFEAYERLDAVPFVEPFLDRIAFVLGELVGTAQECDLLGEQELRQELAVDLAPARWSPWSRRGRRSG